MASNDINQVTMVGRLTQDPELRYTPNGKATCKLSIANNRSYRGPDGNNVEQTSFFNVVIWGKMAEITNQYMAKGRQIALTGRLQQRSWEGQDGKRNYIVEIIADNIQFLGGKGDSAGPRQYPDQYQSAPRPGNDGPPADSGTPNSYSPPDDSFNPDEEDDIPF